MRSNLLRSNNLVPNAIVKAKTKAVAESQRAENKTFPDQNIPSKKMLLKKKKCFTLLKVYLNQTL